MVDIKEVIGKSVKYMGGKPLASYKLGYDSQANQLEPVYYWILDFIRDQLGVLDIEKITDNFMATPGSGQFSEMGAKATAMQQQATKLLADTNTLIKTILNLVYDLKEFEMRLEQYKRANSKNPLEKEEGMLGLKNIWLDQVDMKRGKGSVHQMTYEMGYTTLREAFLIANTREDLERMSAKEGVINDQVKRILIPRLGEFLLWKDMSQKELSKRFEIEKSYLNSEVASLKMYAQWARPYLKAAEELRMKGFDKNAALVSAFSTSMFELTMMAKKEAKIPKNYEKAGYNLKRKYFSIMIVSFKYRGHLGQKSGQGAQSGYAFAFGGRVDMTFDCYCLNEEELSLVKKKLDDEDTKDGLSLVESNTNIALTQLQDDIDHFLSDKYKKEEEKKDKKEDDINPFSALFNISNPFKSAEEKEEKAKVKTAEEIKKDNFIEGIVRQGGAETASKLNYAIYDIYKKAHGMASSPEEFDMNNDEFVNSVKKK